MSAETQDELVRLANRRRTSSGSSLSCTYTTATGGSQLSEAQTDTSNAECARRWEEALKKCKVALKPVDFDIVSQIDSPEKLLAGIEDLRKQTSSSSTGIPAFIAQNALTKSFSELSLVFIASMSPYPVTTGVLWGLLYLAVKLCSDHALASKKLADMVYKIRRQLHLLNRFSRKISDQEEMRVAFVDVFEALILFWAECVNYFRDNPPRTFGTKNWAILEEKFVNATNSVEDAIDHLSKLLDLEPDRQQLRLANLSLKTETASATFPVILLPEPKTEYFIGREDILLDMAAYFWKGDLTKSELSVFCVSGIGGVGKTELALAYAKYHHSEYDAILWIGAENQVSLRRGFTKIAIELGLTGAKIEGNPEANLILVHNWLRITGKKWLLILDNMEKFQEVKDYLPFDSRGSVIVTTRFAAQADHCRRMHRIISKLTVSESQALFVNLIGWGTTGSGVDASEILETKSQEEYEAVTFLLTQMDGLALGIHQMAAIIKFKSLTGKIARFADTYRRRPQKMFQRDGLVGLDGHALGKIWEMSFESARQKSLDAWMLLGILSCLHSDEIHRSMLQIRGERRDGSDLSSSLGFFMDQDEVDDAIDVLISLALIESSDSEVISIHRLTQSAFLFQESMKSAQLQDIFNSASYLTCNAFPKQVKGRAMHKDWEICQTYSQHALYLAELFAGLKRARFLVDPSEEFSSLLSNLVWFMYERGDHQDALLIVDIAVDACLDKNGLPYAHLLNSAAVMHFRLNNLTKSREYLDKSREIREKKMDRRDEELAATYANLAAVESGEGNQDTSLELMNRAMDIRKDVAGAEVMMAIGLMTLGRSLALKGEFIQAAQRYHDSERIFLETVGQRGFLMIGLHFAKGNLSLFQKNLDEALAHFRQSLEIILTHSKVDLKIAALHYKIGFIQLELGQLKLSMQSFSMALDVARLRQRDGGYAEEARSLWKQAQVLERASSPEELAELTQIAVMSDPEHLRQEAEAIRRKLRGSRSSIEGPEAASEELLYTYLVNPWDR